MPSTSVAEHLGRPVGRYDCLAETQSAAARFVDAVAPSAEAGR